VKQTPFFFSCKQKNFANYYASFFYAKTCLQCNKKFNLSSYEFLTAVKHLLLELDAGLAKSHINRLSF